MQNKTLKTNQSATKNKQKFLRKRNKGNSKTENLKPVGVLESKTSENIGMTPQNQFLPNAHSKTQEKGLPKYNPYHKNQSIFSKYLKGSDSKAKPSAAQKLASSGRFSPKSLREELPLHSINGANKRNRNMAARKNVKIVASKVQNFNVSPYKKKVMLPSPYEQQLAKKRNQGKAESEEKKQSNPTNNTSHNEKSATPDNE